MDRGRVTPSLHHFAYLLSLTLSLFALLALTESPAIAEPDPAPASAAADSSEPEPPPVDDEARELRRKQLTAGLYLLFGIITVGSGMLLWIIWWGFRIRRRLLKPLPPAPRGDELWFLKHPIESQTANPATHRKGEPP